MTVKIRRRTLLGAGIVAAAGAGCSSSDQAQEDGFALTNVRIFDGETFLDSNTVIVESGQISQVGSDLAIPDGVEEVDGSGQTVLPGLIDAHVHDFRAYYEDALRFGTTTMCDLGSSNSDLTDQAVNSRDDREQSTHSDVFTAGTFITSPAGHGSQFGSLPTIDDDTDIDEFMADRLAERPDFIKFLIESDSSFENTLTVDQARQVVEATHEAGLLTVAHAHSFDDFATALEAGADIMAHGPIGTESVDEDVIELLAERGTAVIATLAVTTQGCSDIIDELVSNEDLRPFLSADQLEVAEELSSRQCNVEYNPQLDGVRAAYEAGVPILAGTDYGNWGLVAGISLFHELALLHEVGMSHADVLAAATSAPADAFRFEDRGRIAEGMWADLLLIDGDLSEELPSPENIVGVWKNGLAVDREP